MDNEVRGMAVVMAFLAAPCVVAQEVLPRPEEAFKDAKIGRTYKDSKPGTMALTGSDTVPVIVPRSP